MLEHTGAQTGITAYHGDSVTAIIPTFRRHSLVRKAILSALGQTYGRLDEVLVIVDGRDEETRDVASCIDDRRLRVIELAGHAGAAKARNIGVGFAKSDWVAFLDDDDEWLPTKIAAQVEAARSVPAKYPVLSSRLIVRTPSCDWISPSRLYAGGEPMSEYLFCRRGFVDAARYMQTSTLMMRRELMMRLPFHKHLKRHQDWDWLLRAAAYPGVGFKMLPEPLTIFHVEDGRSSLGRSLDWEFSRAWAREMRAAFTPRAYSFFVATECMSRAVKSNAGVGTYAKLVWEFFSRGRPTTRALLNLAAFLCVPERLRTWIRQAVRRFRTHFPIVGSRGQAMPSSPTA